MADGVLWVQGAVLGTTATVVAIIAVAAIGLLMLTGRLELRRGVTVVIGCFILFGAGGIAASLAGQSRTEERYLASSKSSALAGTQRSPQSFAYDPYAGASVPSSR